MVKTQTKQNEVTETQNTDNQPTARVLPDFKAAGILPDIDDISAYVGRTRGACKYETQARALVAAGRGAFVIPVTDEVKLATARAYVAKLNRLDLGGKFVTATAVRAHVQGYWREGDVIVKLDS